MLSQIKKSKYSYLTLSQIRVFSFFRGQDLTISDLAKQMNISRQAVQKTIAMLLDHELIELAESPKNLSAKLIKVTDKGRKLKSWSKRASAKSEKELAEKMGPEKVKALKEILNVDWD